MTEPLSRAELVAWLDDFSSEIAAYVPRNNAEALLNKIRSVQLAEAARMLEAAEAMRDVAIEFEGGLWTSPNTSRERFAAVVAAYDAASSALTAHDTEAKP